MVINSFSFCFFDFLFPSFIDNKFAGYIILGWHFFFVFQLFEYIILFSPGLKGFCQKMCLVWWEFPYKWLDAFLLLFLELFLFLWLLTIWLWCTLKKTFGLCLFQDLWASCIWMFKFLAKLGIRPAIIWLNGIFMFFIFSSPS